MKRFNQMTEAQMNKKNGGGIIGLIAGSVGVSMATLGVSGGIGYAAKGY